MRLVARGVRPGIPPRILGAMNMPFPVAIHLASTLAALVLGAALLSRRVKGDRAHRIAGWSWVLLMVIAGLFALVPGRRLGNMVLAMF